MPLPKYIIEKPPKPNKEENIDLIIKLNTEPGLLKWLDKFNAPKYLYWDKMKRSSPVPFGLSSSKAWSALKLSRILKSQATPISTPLGHHFSWIELNIFRKFCHEFDLNRGGELSTAIDHLSRNEQQKLISKGIMEEAIASSQLEGANTGRQYAKKMLRESIKPRNDSEQMILNNHRAMLDVENELSNAPLSMDVLMQMHGTLTEKTKDSEGRTPKLRPDGEPICVHDEHHIFHEGPSTNFVKAELPKLISYANDDLDEDSFVHPVIKASLIHFWMGYLHPFTDGNGRLARLLFYWYLLKNRYWVFKYLPLSAAIKNDKNAYTMAYVYSEQDNSDVTYFLSYIIRKLQIVSNNFQAHVDRMHEDNAKMAKIAHDNLNLNDRQIHALKYLNANSNNYTSVSSYVSINNVSKPTAIKDLKILEEKELIDSKRQGRYVRYYGTEKLGRLFE